MSDDIVKARLDLIAQREEEKKAAKREFEEKAIAALVMNLWSIFHEQVQSRVDSLSDEEFLEIIATEKRTNKPNCENIVAISRDDALRLNLYNSDPNSQWVRDEAIRQVCGRLGIVFSNLKFGANGREYDFSDANCAINITYYLWGK